MKGYLNSVKKDFAGVKSIWNKYWESYGGWNSVFSSTYFLAALVLTILNYGAWSTPGWWDTVISTSPTILGFTLAGLAVFLGMDSGFSKFIAGRRNGKTSPFGGLVSAFLHFIIVQSLAFIVALTHKSLAFSSDILPEWWDALLKIANPIAWFISYLIYMYSVTQIVAAAFAVFRASTWYEMHIEILKQEEEEIKNKQDTKTDKV